MRHAAQEHKRSDAIETITAHTLRPLCIHSYGRMPRAPLDRAAWCLATYYLEFLADRRELLPHGLDPR